MIFVFCEQRTGGGIATRTRDGSNTKKIPGTKYKVYHTLPTVVAEDRRSKMYQSIDDYHPKNTVHYYRGG